MTPNSFPQQSDVPAKPKSSVLMWILGCGCGCLVMLGALGGLIYFLVNHTHAFD